MLCIAQCEVDVVCLLASAASMSYHGALLVCGTDSAVTILTGDMFVVLVCWVFQEHKRIIKTWVLLMMIIMSVAVV